MAQTLLSIVIPCYNEANTLKDLLQELDLYCRDYQWKVVLVNDGSTDQTKKVLKELQDYAWLKIIHHKLNRGYGAAIKSGIAMTDSEYIITMDADGQHHPDDVVNLLHFIREKDADMVIGSRKGTPSSNPFRHVGKSIIRILAKIMMTVPVHDLNSGMKIYRCDLAKQYLHLAPDTMSFSDVIALIFINHRHLVLETPITIRQRVKGKSKIGMQTAFQTIMEVINIVILFSPIKIFLPLSILCFLVGFIWGLPLMIQGRGISIGAMLGISSGLILFMLGLIAEQLSWLRRNSGKNPES
jgi:glycosyltransferase involved in cell wall biosynthesis